MSQSTLTLADAVGALGLEVTIDEAKQDIRDGLLVTAEWSNDVVWIGDWFRWMRYRRALEQFPPEKRPEFREAMFEALARKEAPGDA
jgi:tRNA G10  N-methylase Trm11